MTTPAPQPLPNPSDPGDNRALARPNPLANLLPQPKEPLISPDTPLRYIDAPAPDSPQNLPRKDGEVLRGLKDLQQLQKQTIAVLETLQSSLEDIHHVLRSPEATRGLEKQKNAATLLAKGFAHEAVDQARDAAQLLPANPEAQLLLALSLAADQQLDPALAATRKGLALIDRRAHPIAIEAGLLHALAALGSVPEALERWSAIIETLPLPVLLEHIPRIAACYPSTQIPPEDLDLRLDTLLATRITRGRFRNPDTPHHERLIDTRPSQIPAPALLAGLDAASQHHLPLTHRAVLVLFAQHLNALRDPNDILKYTVDCLIPLGNRSQKCARPLGRRTVKQLLRFHADAPTLHRVLLKLQMAGCNSAAVELAKLLNHWRHAGKRFDRARQLATASLTLLLTGAAVFAWTLFPMGAIHGRQLALPLPFGQHINALYAGPLLIFLGALLGLLRLLHPTPPLTLPHNRPPLTLPELRFLQSPDLRQSLRSLRKPNPKQNL